MNKETKVKWKEAFLGKCPNCGSGRIFKNPLDLKSKCSSCEIDFEQFETADGPAFFAIAIIGTLVGIGAGVVEVIFQPRFWVHLVLWLPLIAIGSVIIIRMTKALMVAHQLKLKK